MVERRQELEDICANRGRYPDINRKNSSIRKQSSQSLCPPRIGNGKNGLLNIPICCGKCYF